MPPSLQLLNTASFSSPAAGAKDRTGSLPSASTHTPMSCSVPHGLAKVSLFLGEDRS